MHLELIQNFEALDSQANEWNDLLACCSASHVPFLRYEYLSTWWKTLGGGEWKEASLYIYLARRQDGGLLGIAPLFYAKNRQGVPSMLLVGSIEISDYLDVICPTPDLPAFMEGLFEALTSDQAPPWQALDFYNINENSPTLPALEAAAQRRGWSFSQQQLQPCPYIPLPGDWEQYLASIDKKQRHEIRRKMRRAEESATPVRWYIVGGENYGDQTVTEAALNAEIEEFMALMAMDPDKDRFLTQVMRTQMRSAVHAAFRAGWLQLAFLEVDGKKAAGYLNFDFANHIWVYNSGINFDYRELSPGWVLLGYLLKWANENRREAFDFMRGDEDYKYRFGGINRYVVRALICR
ncbi:MAG: GNAT family N-acetyltransferase [Anaerolineales bacterium]|nr:GNAT family N-acetyltransferase [Anaerolineales bacterium]